MGIEDKHRREAFEDKHCLIIGIRNANEPLVTSAQTPYGVAQGTGRRHADPAYPLVWQFYIAN